MEPNQPVGPTKEPVFSGAPLRDMVWLGASCSAAIVTSAALGIILDALFHLSPWCTLGGLFLGVASAVALAYNKVKGWLK